MIGRLRELLAVVIVAGAMLLVFHGTNVTSMPDAVRIPIVSPHPPGTPQSAALFRHSTHSQGHCYACHPGIFPRYPEGFTHADMRQGLYCANCHNGQGAAAIAAMSCETCHVPE